MKTTRENRVAKAKRHIERNMPKVKYKLVKSYVEVESEPAIKEFKYLMNRWDIQGAKVSAWCFTTARAGAQFIGASTVTHYGLTILNARGKPITNAPNRKFGDYAGALEAALDFICKGKV